MVKVSIRVSKDAAKKSRNHIDLKKDALDAFQAAGCGDIYCLPFRSAGRQFALSSRMVLDIDFLPNRVPARPLKEPPVGAFKRRRT